MKSFTDKELIFVFTGPNGAGRKTIAEMAGSTINMKQVLSYTTRKQRPNEEEGRDYFFISRDEFQKAQAGDEFVESLEIDGNWYGIKSSDIESQLGEFGCVYLIVNGRGAEILKNLYGDKVKRFFIYAAKETISGRLRARGDAEDRISVYMSHVEEEMEYQSKCEHTYENFDSSHTIYDVTKVMEQYLQRGLLDLD
jgi:guanylate kinase